MTCENEVWQDNVRYCLFDDGYVVGTNSSDDSNAVKSTTSISGILRIPKKINGINVYYILSL